MCWRKKCTLNADVFRLSDIAGEDELLGSTGVGRTNRSLSVTSRGHLVPPTSVVLSVSE